MLVHLDISHLDRLVIAVVIGDVTARERPVQLFTTPRAARRWLDECATIKQRRWRLRRSPRPARWHPDHGAPRDGAVFFPETM